MNEPHNHDHGDGDHQHDHGHPGQDHGPVGGGAKPAHGHRHGHGGHGHSHTHGMTATGRHRKQLILVLCITGAIFVAEVIGGLISGSLALLADAGHMLTDATGLVVALIAASLAMQPASSKRTFGLQRAEVLAALANAILLVGIAVWVLIQAVSRLREPAAVETGVMLVVAVVGALANCAGLLILHRGQGESLNMRGAYLEVLGDLLGSAAVVVAAVLIMLTGWTRWDAIASLAIFALIVPRAWSLLRDVIDVLLEATPRHIDLDEVRRHILGVPGVVDVHDLHVWTITSGVPVMSAHIVVADDHVDQHGVLDRLGSCLGGHFDVEHCTFQIEPATHAEHETVHHD